MSATAAPGLFAAAAAGVLRVPTNGIHPQLAMAGRRLHLVYFAGDPRHGDIYYCHSADFGGTFSPGVRVNSQPGSAIAIGAIRGAQLAVGRNGRVHVAWNGSDVAGAPQHAPMLYTRLNDRGTGFEPQRNVMRETFGLDGGGSVAADRAGNVYVAWHGKAPGPEEGEAGRRVFIAKSTDDGRTFAKEHTVSAEGTGACGCCALRVFADSRGVVYGLYRSATENVHRDIHLLRSADAGRTFSDALLHAWKIDACPMSSMELIEADGEVLGAWETQEQVYFAPVSKGVRAAKAAICAPPGDHPKRKYPALARNTRGETLLAWVEGAGWQRGGKSGWQIFDRAGRPAASCGTPTGVPVWSFPAAFARPDGRFTIIV